MHKDDSRQETSMNWDQRDAAWTAQAVAVLDHFSESEVRAVLARTTLKDHVRDAAVLRAILLDEATLAIVRRRAAQQVLMAAGIFTQEPMTPVIISWDWKGQPDMAGIAAAVTRISGERRPVVMRMIDTGADEYAVVIADRAVTDEEAAEAQDAQTASLERR
jgi:hypothetical protein